MIRYNRIIIIIMLAVSLTILNYFVPFASAAVLKPSAAQPGGFQPGLSVLYIHNFHYRHLDKLPTGKKLERKGKPGKPIPYLNHRFGKEKVFESGVSRLIGLHMTGYFHMAKTGTYRFKAFINDGIRLFMGNNLIVDEPKWNAKGDRYTEPGEVTISAPGWYPVTIRYFQRKGTATLIFYWQKPGDKDFTVIPAEAYAH